MTKKDFIIELRNIGMTQADFFKLAGRKTRSLTNVKDDEEIATWHINFLKILKDFRILQLENRLLRELINKKN
ncbi:hypothetical protein G6W42_06805 [Campylobacter concisus]|uniref:hypothetical protein n=1 Tax=Campylobacter concisus TaxID=199 RepID=UPI0018843A8C|nr:hypothetical protein [Campylobacter concisus]MBE9852330.1 hypothetical protein [Campylobacter concisus]